MGFLSENFRARWLALVVLSLLSFSGLSVAEEVVMTPPNLEVVFSLESDKKVDPAGLRRICPIIGNSLRVGRGPWGVGIFRNFSCMHDGKVIFGKARKKRWSLRITQKPKEVEISLFNELTNETPVARLQFEATEDSFRFFEDTGFVDIVALALLEQLPFKGWIGPNDIQSDSDRLMRRAPRTGRSMERVFELPPPDQELILYEVRYRSDGGIWRSNVVGRATLADVKEPSPRERRKIKGRKRFENAGQAEWSLSEVQNEGFRGAWVHGASGPRSQSASFDKILVSANQKLIEASSNGDLDNFLKGGYNFLTSALLDTAASGYVGLRYGKQVLAGDELLGKTSFFGLLVEMRGGPLEGLRVYYDKMPQVKNINNGFETQISWSRVILGKSWGWSPGFLVDRLDVTPKIGMWSLSATLPTAFAEDGITPLAVQTFATEKALGLAIEGGVEWLSTWYLLRAWGAFDTALNFGRIGAAGVTSQRFGIDGYLTAGPEIRIFGVPFKTALLGFFLFESIELSQNPDEENLEDQIVGIGYQGGYAGVGGVLSW